MNNRRRRDLAYQDIRATESIVFAGVIAALIVLAGGLSPERERTSYFVAAGLTFVVGIVAIPPRTVWFENDELCARRWGRVTRLSLRDVSKVSVSLGFKAPPTLFFEREDGSGFLMHRLDEASQPLRTAVGEALREMGATRRASREARVYLGLEN